MDRVRDWLAVLEEHYPARDAQSWDSVGLQVGDPDDEVTAVLVCLDVTEATLAEAADRGASMVLAHHPLLFRPLERLTPGTAAGALALRAARAGLTVVAAHTNLDAAPDGTTAPIMALLGAADALPLVPAAGDQICKVVVFVPADAAGVVLDAAFDAGAGRIGEYEECSFSAAGTGTFRPSSAANPAIGEREQRNAVPEHRVEVVVGRRVLGRVVDAIVASHPYEEVALDVHPLLRPPAASAANDMGLGRIATLAAPLPLRDIAARLRTGLPSPHLRYAGDPNRGISRVAACGGAGDSLIAAALAAGADAFITGDLRHHVALDAVTQGMAVIDAGHFATEAPALEAFGRRISSAARRRNLTARLLPSETRTDPWVHEEEQHR